MRAHEGWCASRYHQDGVPPAACDCGAVQENAQHLAPFNPLTGGEKPPTSWAGRLPDQFCVKCEGGPVKAVVITPKPGRPEPTRIFAACLAAECTHIRELNSDALQ